MNNLIAAGTISSLALGGEDVPYAIHAPTSGPAGKAAPMAVYLRGLSGERLGTASDEDIVGGLLAGGMLVAVVDYGGRGSMSLAEVTHLYTAFGARRHDPLFAQCSFQGKVPHRLSYGESRLRISHGDAVYEVDPDWVYVLPEGFTVHRDIEVTRLPYPAPRDRVRMDLIAPARPRRPVPLVLEPSATSTGEDDAEMKVFNFNAPYVMSYACFGYAVAVMGFVYPDSRGVDGWEVGLDAAERKAIRLLRARKEEWGLSGKIGMMGISKSSSRVLLTAAKRPGQKPGLSLSRLDEYPYSVFYKAALPDWLAADFPEEVKDSWFPYNEPDAWEGVAEERDLGPHAGESDRPNVIHCSAGGPMGFNYVVPYLTADLPPVILNVGSEDGRDGHRVGQATFKLLRDALRAAGVDKLLYVEQEGLGHAYNHICFEQLKEFFDAELK